MKIEEVLQSKPAFPKPEKPVKKTVRTKHGQKRLIEAGTEAYRQCESFRHGQVLESGLVKNVIINQSMEN